MEGVSNMMSKAKTKSQYERIAVDPRIVQRVQGDSRMRREQGSGFMQRWGGSDRYVQVAKMSMPDRVTYMAVQDGWDSPGDIVSATGLSAMEVNASLKNLQKEGYVSEVSKEVVV